MSKEKLFSDEKIQVPGDTPSGISYLLHVCILLIRE